MAASLALIAAPAPSGAQVADDVANLEMIYAVTQPSAGVLKRGQYRVGVRTYGDGGVLGEVSVGLFDRFMFGVSHGGNQLLGTGQPEGNSLPGVRVKYRLVEESWSLPAMTLGFDMQGLGPWDGSWDRYQYKAPGLFFAASRNFISDYGRFGIHAGVNYNTVEVEDQRSLDGWAALDVSFNEQLALVLEYDLALDDANNDDRFGQNTWWGYLNAGLRFTFAQALVLQLDVIDLLGNSQEAPGMNRMIKIVYVETFPL
jgi:hypothetical protein